MQSKKAVLAVLAAASIGMLVSPEAIADDGPRLSPRISQGDILGMNQRSIRAHGLRIFSTPFNLEDGLGDGPINPADTVSPGGRPTLGNNGIFLRMNGLDAQTCLECHSVLSNATIPSTFTVGGVGNVSDSAFPGMVDPDIDDSEGNGFARISGRMINPPFSFGSGGVEMLAKEMTRDLQALKAQAEANPGASIALETKGVSFGWISFDGVNFDTSDVEGVDDDLVIRPFGRKGCCQTIRQFDQGAMQFHHGIQPSEIVGDGVDADGDGVVNELSVGELSAMHIFQTSMERPRQDRVRRGARRGRDLFASIGCADCHRPSLTTEDRHLPIAFPEVDEDPWANVFFEIDLSRSPTKFKRHGHGVRVELFADLKRHDMGPGLAETTGDALDPFFHTARLWGVADTAPYMHDGRAVTISQAILLHGGEGQASRDEFDALDADQQDDVVAFLKTLRTPRNPSNDLLNGNRHHDDDDD